MSSYEEPDFQDPDDQNSNITVQMDRPNIPVKEPSDEASYHPPPAEPVYLPPDWDNTHLAKRMFNKYGTTTITINRIDRYGNSILLGSFCYAITFIVYGFHRCKAHPDNETFIWAMILFFGSIGQATAGFLELIKGRHFPSALYLCTGFYCLSHFMLYMFPKILLSNNVTEMTYIFYSGSICTFYSALLFIYFALCLASVKSNILLLLQTLTCFVFMLLRAIGEGTESLHTKRNAAGILQVVSGFLSLLVFVSQVLNNEAFKSPVFPSVPLDPNNRIDIPASKR